MHCEHFHQPLQATSVARSKWHAWRRISEYWKQPSFTASKGQNYEDLVWWWTDRFQVCLKVHTKWHLQILKFSWCNFRIVSNVDKKPLPQYQPPAIQRGFSSMSRIQKYIVQRHLQDRSRLSTSNGLFPPPDSDSDLHSETDFCTMQVFPLVQIQTLIPWFKCIE